MTATAEAWQATSPTINSRQTKRLSGKKLTETDGQIGLAEDKPPLDVGFRVLKLDESNLKIWDNTPIPNGVNAVSEPERRLLAILDIIKEDRSDLDVVYEVM